MLATAAQEVSINDLSFVFAGPCPDEPVKFSWSLIIPDWEPSRDAIVPPPDLSGSPSLWAERLVSRGLCEGAVGILKTQTASVSSPEDPAIVIDRIETATRLLSPKSPYRGAKGLGSFLLKGICDLADRQSWDIYLEPVHLADGPLPFEALKKWYGRYGFKQLADTMHPDGSMLRQPF